MPGPDDMTARAKELAKDILDELDKPTSKERQDQIAQKEREDAEALEQFYIETGQITQEQLVKRLLHELADKIERLDPPDGPFDPVEIVFTLNKRKAVLRFAPSPSRAEKRYVELELASESRQSTSRQWLEAGPSAHLVAYLREPEVVAGTLALADELAQALARHRLA